MQYSILAKYHYHSTGPASPYTYPSLEEGKVLCPVKPLLLLRPSEPCEEPPDLTDSREPGESPRRLARRSTMFAIGLVRSRDDTRGVVVGAWMAGSGPWTHTQRSPHPRNSQTPSRGSRDGHTHTTATYRTPHAHRSETEVRVMLAVAIVPRYKHANIATLIEEEEEDSSKDEEKHVMENEDKDEVKED